MTLHAHYNKENFEGFYIHTPSDEHYKLRTIHSLGYIDRETSTKISTYDSLMANIKDTQYASITSERISGELLFMYIIKLAMNKEVETIELPGLVFVSKATREELNQRYMDEHEPKIVYKCDPNHEPYERYTYSGFDSSIITAIETECFGYITVNEETKEIDIHAGRAFFPRWTYEAEEYEHSFSTSLKSDLNITVTIAKPKPYKPSGETLYFTSFHSNR